VSTPWPTPFLPLVFLPAFARKIDVILLPLIGSPAKQQHDPLPILAEVDPVSRAKVDAALKDTTGHALYV
jgi:hypothetical protein